MIATTHEDVIALLDRYVVEHDDAILLPTIRSLMDDDAECVIAIQRGSGNEGGSLRRVCVPDDEGKSAEHGRGCHLRQEVCAAAHDN